MLKRTQAVDFQVSEAKREDYFSYLNLFRQAQQLESSKETDCSEAYNCMINVCRYGILTLVNY